MSRRLLITFVAALALLTSALALSACGGGDDSTGGDSSTTAEGGGSKIQKEATESLKQWLDVPKELWIKTPLPKPPPTDVTISVMDCGVPACTAWAEAVKEGAEALGWTATRIPQGITPQEITAAWNQVVRELPDAVVTIGIPKVLFSKQLATLKANDIPVLNAAVDEGAGEGQVLALAGPSPFAEETGNVWADYVISKLGEDANVLAVSSPEFPITEAYERGFLKYYEEYCPDCGVTKLQVSAAQVGNGQNTTQIIGALRSNPDVNFIVSNDALTVGLPGAMKTAGLDVPIIGEAPTPTQFGYIEEDGVYQGSVVFAPYEVGWQMVDWLARYIEGVPTKPAEAEMPTFLLTKETLEPGATEFYPFIPDWDKEFEALWGVG